MGLLREPDLYRCGIDWVGVTDIELLFTGSWSGRSDLSPVFRQYGMPALIGGPVPDAQQLAATSPLNNAARIRQPLLMAYGGADLRVPLYHGRTFHDAIRGTNPDAELVVYDKEGHGWYLPETRTDFGHRVEAFLERNIGH